MAGGDERLDDGTANNGLALARGLVDAFDAIRRALPPPAGGVGERLADHLGVDHAVPGVVERFPISERVNVQVALDTLEAASEHWELIGLQSDIGNFNGFSVTALASGRFGGHIEEQAVEYTALAVDIDATIACFRAGLVLTRHGDVPIGILVFPVERGMQPEVVVEVVAAGDGTAADALARLKAIMREKNVFRGKTIAFSFGRHGDFGLRFAHVPSLSRSQVILPEATLTAIEEHTITMTQFASELAGAGQHLRRGLLLYGPPGTGKTHTVMYLCNQLVGRTVIILSGPAVQAVGQAGSLARDLQPAMIVIEDVDLIGLDRGLPGGAHNPLLFQLLNEMDGIGDDADVIFVLTTNRVDLLEPALAARPGRVDSAIEVPLPDEEARSRLFQLYLPDQSIRSDVLDAVVAGTAGVPAAFIKELSRRCVLHSLAMNTSFDEALPRALNDMLTNASPVLRRTLGVITE